MDEIHTTPRWRAISRFPGNIDSPAPSARVEVDFGACSVRGPLRPVNDDHYLIVRLGRHQETLLTSLPYGEVPPRFDEFAYGMVIADGMGREAETASRLAITTLAHQTVYFGEWNVRVDEPTANDVMERAHRFFKNVDAALLAAASGNPSGLQTTLTVVYTAGNELFFAYVGDSSVYMFRDGALMQLTRDHPPDYERPGPAAIFDMAAGAPDLNYVEPETLGGTRLTRPRVGIERCGLLDGDVILLCTNGLTDVVDDSRIADMLRLHGKPDDQCRALVDLATRSGSYDDVTTIVAHYRIAPHPETDDSARHPPR